MTKNVQIVLNGYEIAERQDAEGYIATFTLDGAFINEALGVRYRGRDVAIPLMIFARAFPDASGGVGRRAASVLCDAGTRAPGGLNGRTPPVQQCSRR